MDVDNTGDAQLPTAKQPQQTEAGVPGRSANNGVKVLTVLCGGAIKVMTPTPKTQNACHASRHGGPVACLRLDMQGLKLKIGVKLRWSPTQVLDAPSKDGSTRAGDVTLRRERCLVDALQRQLFLRVSAIRRLFRVRDMPQAACAVKIHMKPRLSTSTLCAIACHLSLQVALCSNANWRPSPHQQREEAQGFTAE